MADPKINPIRETDETARALARELIQGARYGALGVLDPQGAPHVTRVAVATTALGQPLTLISDLSTHTQALKRDPICSLLLGEPGDKGDPLTHPRITLQAKARLIRHDAQDHSALRSRYLDLHPKAQLYIDFADFNFALFEITEAHLNGGFGKAFHLTPADFQPSEET